MLGSTSPTKLLKQDVKLCVDNVDLTETPLHEKGNILICHEESSMSEDEKKSFKGDRIQGRAVLKENSDSNMQSFRGSAELIDPAVLEDKIPELLAQKMGKMITH